MAIKLFMVFLFSHIIGDFYLQSKKLSKIKDKKLSQLAIHACIYAAVVFATTLLYFSVPMLVLAAVVIVLHFLIDYSKMLFIKAGNKLQKKKGNPLKEGTLYIIDQALHISAIFIACAVYIALGWGFAPHQWVVALQVFLGLDLALIAKWALTLLIIIQPVSITFTKLFSQFKPIQDEIQDNRGAGEKIGWIERVLIVVLMSMGQYAAIGLAITAKSIVRYPKIKGGADNQFGEYYLLGTLFSFISAIVIYNLIW